MTKDPDIPKRKGEVSLKEDTKKHPYLKKSLLIAAELLILIGAILLPVFAWLSTSGLLAYIPVSSHESLYIGAGHIEIVDAEFDPDVKLEDVRYLYLEGVDLTDEDKDYFDYVFCIYGISIERFNLQLAYTTNNQFTYKIFNATEASVSSEGAVVHTTHDENYPQTFYYKATGEEIPGTYLNKTVSGDGKTIADSSEHTTTYGSYSSVNRFAEPIYWQTSSYISSGVARGAFVKYFILRVYKGEKEINDRETDVICIAAKSAS